MKKVSVVGQGMRMDDFPERLVFRWSCHGLSGKRHSSLSQHRSEGGVRVKCPEGCLRLEKAGTESRWWEGWGMISRQRNRLNQDAEA